LFSFSLEFPFEELKKATGEFSSDKREEENSLGEIFLSNLFGTPFSIIKLHDKLSLAKDFSLPDALQVLR